MANKKFTDRLGLVVVASNQARAAQLVKLKPHEFKQDYRFIGKTDEAESVTQTRGSNRAIKGVK